jgi:hypothetical protein
MKVIPETRRVHLFAYLPFYHYHWVDSLAGGLLVPEGITHLVVSASLLLNPRERLQTRSNKNVNIKVRAHDAFLE